MHDRRPLRLAVIDQTGDEAGGAQESLFSLLRFMPDDIEPVVFAFNDGKFANRLRDAGITVEIYPVSDTIASSTRERFGIDGAVAAPRAVIGLARRLRAERIDVVYTHTVKAHVIGGLAALNAGIASVPHYRDILEGNARTLIRAIGNVSSKERLAITEAVREAYGLDRTVVVDEPLEQPHYGSGYDRSHACRELGLPPDVPIVAMIGRINRWKGHDRFVRALAGLRERFDFHVMIVGSAMYRDADFVGELHELVEASGLSERTTFVPWLDDPSVAYAAIDIHCNCSTKEPFGRTTIEAAAAAVPTICFDDGGASEAVENGVSGLVVPAGDEAALSAAIATYLSDDSKRRAAGVAAQRGLSRYEPRLHAERVADVLRSAAERTRHRGKSSTPPAVAPPSTNASGVRRIVIVVDSAHVNGGSAQVALTSAIALAGRGYDVTVFAGTGPVMPELLDVARLRVICLNQIDIRSDPIVPRAAIRGIWNFAAAREFSRMLAGYDAGDTVVHVHSWTKSLTASVMHAAKRRGFKIVMTLHDFFAVCPNGCLYNHRKQQICALRPMSAACITTDCDSRSYAHKLWRVGRQIVQSAVAEMPEKVDDLISVSELSESLMRPYLDSSTPVHAVTYPVDVEREPMVDAAANSDLVFIGRLSYEKGAEVFALAATKANLSPVFVGDGPCRKRIQILAPQSSFRGWQDHEGVLTALRTARALIFPSVWYETFGLVVLEAAALGIPAIVPDTSAARANVEDGVTGLHVRGGDVDDLQLKLERLADDDFVRRMGRAAYERYWAKPLTMSDHVAGLARVYESMSV